MRSASERTRLARLARLVACHPELPRALGRGLTLGAALCFLPWISLGGCAETTPPEPSAGGEGPTSGGSSGWGGAAGDRRSSSSSAAGIFRVDAGEECDDGNTEDDDGCSARCRRETRGSGDVCPGETIELTQVDEGVWRGSFSGDTSARYHQYFGSCGGSGAEQIFTLVAPIEGQLTWRVQAQHDALVYVRATCDDETSETVCLDESPRGATETLISYVRRGEPLYLFIDGLGKTDGPFELEALLETVECGNGILEPSEACDDGNLRAGDGCDDRCRLESPSFAACPGAQLRLDPSKVDGARVVLRGTNWAHEPKERPLVCPGTGPEAVYAISAAQAGNLEARLVAATTRHTIYARSACEEASTQLACATAAAGSAGDPSLPAPLRFPLDEGETVYVFVDGPSSVQQGDFQIEFALAEATCGNGRVDPGEECDDGDSGETSDAGDGCTACQLEPAAARDACPGHTLLFREDAGLLRARHTHTTAALVGNYQSQGALVCATRAAPDAVYHFVAPESGALRAELEAAFDGALQLRALCDIERELTSPGLSLPEIQALRAQELACRNAVTGQGSEIIEARVEAGRDYWVLVSSPLAAQSGLYTLSLLLTPDPGALDAVESKLEDGAP